MGKNDNKQLLWSDRKRILGMPISFTKYELDEERLTIHRGLVTTTVDETLLYRILDIRMSQKLGQKIFGVGTIHMFCADRTDQHLDLENIKNPNEVRRQLSRIVEKARTEKRMVGREMYGTADMGIVDDMDDIDN